jgi:hypothetical protein
MSCFEDNFGEISEVLFEEWLAEQEAEEANGYGIEPRAFVVWAKVRIILTPPCEKTLARDWIMPLSLQVEVAAWLRRWSILGLRVPRDFSL